MTTETVRMNRVTLAFDDVALERAFKDEYADSVRSQMRYAWLVGAAVLAAIAVVDPSTRAGFVSRVIRYALAIPAVLLVLTAAFTPPATFRRVGPTANAIAGSAMLAIVPAQTLALYLWVQPWTAVDDPATLYSFGEAGELVLLFAILTVSTVRFFHGTLPAVASVVVYLAAAPACFPNPGFIALTMTVTPAALMFGMVASYQLETSRRRLFLERRQLVEERAKSERLLRNVLPTAIAERLKSDPSHIADGFTEVTILFADIVGFTDLSARLSPAEVVAMLNRLFTAFDDLADKHGLEKIKTIGDAYMVVGGLPEARSDHAEAVVAMAVAMRDAVADVSLETGYDLKVRIGANTGPVVAGVIGKKKFAYDLWGDAVNTASRMESHGLAGEIQITASTCERVKDAFEVESRGMTQVKGKGELATWFVRGRKGGGPGPESPGGASGGAPESALRASREPSSGRSWRR